MSIYKKNVSFITLKDMIATGMTKGRLSRVVKGNESQTVSICLEVI